MVAIAIITILAGFIESTTELVFGTWLKGPYMLMLTLAVGVVAAFAFNITILHSIVGLDVNTVADMIFSGLVMGRGAQFVHDFVPSLNLKNDK